MNNTMAGHVIDSVLMPLQEDALSVSINEWRKNMTRVILILVSCREWTPRTTLLLVPGGSGLSPWESDVKGMSQHVNALIASYPLLGSQIDNHYLSCLHPSQRLIFMQKDGNGMSVSKGNVIVCMCQSTTGLWNRFDPISPPHGLYHEWKWAFSVFTGNP